MCVQLGAVKPGDLSTQPINVGGGPESGSPGGSPAWQATQEAWMQLKAV
jgi:hypothetical protein